MIELELSKPRRDRDGEEERGKECRRRCGWTYREGGVGEEGLQVSLGVDVAVALIHGGLFSRVPHPVSRLRLRRLLRLRERSLNLRR